MLRLPEQLGPGPGIVTAERVSGVGSRAGREATAKQDSRAGQVLRLFDAKAAGWPAKYAQDGPLAGRLASLSEAVRRHAWPGDRVLDLGCGTGELTQALAAAGLRVTGCDISPQMLLRAARDPSGRGPGQPGGIGRAGWVRLEPGWRSLPFVSEAFDVVVAASVLEYVAEPAAVLRECARVLRPRGVLLYTVPDLRHPVRWAEWAVRRLTGGLSGGGRRPPPAAGRRARWDGYRAYLRASRQRHRVRWWLTASGLAGLYPVPCPADGGRSTLRLLAFRRAGQTGARQ